jgi:hypothetical protein
MGCFRSESMIRQNKRAELYPIGRETTWSVKGGENCFGLRADLKRGDEKSISDHVVNEET